MAPSSELRDTEKEGDISHSELPASLSSVTAADDERITGFTEKERKRIVRRVDLRLVVPLGVLYFVSLLDRSNLGIAAIAGYVANPSHHKIWAYEIHQSMQAELRMNASNNAYSIVSLVFFFTYIFFQPVTTVVIRKIKPHVFLPGICLAWGLVVLGFGFVQNWQTLLGLRIILGLFEAGLYPGAIYLLSTWYPRYDLQQRNSLFFALGISATLLGGPLGYGLIQMHGLGGYSGWRWLFIMQGIITCVIAVASYFPLVDFPEDAHKRKNFLNEREAAFIIASIEHDRKDVEVEPFSMRLYLEGAKDSNVWLYALMYMLTTTNTYGLTFFSPIILNGGLGFSVALSLCLGGLPVLFAIVYMSIQSYYADKWHLRGPMIVLNCFVGIVGTALVGYTSNTGLRFFGLFLTSAACSANGPALVTYQANNIRGQWKRSLASATLVGFGGIGGIAGSTVFRAQDSPNYRPGLMACMIAYALTIAIVCWLTFKFRRANKRAEAGGKLIEGLAGFKYTY